MEGEGGMVWGLNYFLLSLSASQEATWARYLLGVIILTR
jgi:hypothetical protein